MKINEVEQAIGISKKNIRFYEDAGLLTPSRSGNGYRNYSDEDINTLRQIKLLRKLDIPLEEIKHLQSGILTLEDCLHRHLIVLKRRARNLNAMEQFCGRILEERTELTCLSVERLLSEMENMEKGGTKFVDIRKQDKTKRKKDSLIAAIVAIIFMALFLALSIWSCTVDPDVPIVLTILLISLPAIGIIGTILALKERFKEIEGGELDEASKY